MRLNDLADALIDLLADAATDPGRGGGYMAQADLAEALHVRVHTVSDVVTRAALRVRNLHPGCAITYNRVEGYRLVEAITVRDQAVEVGRLRKARTAMSRMAIACGAGRNGPVSKMVGRQLETVIATVIDPAIEQLLEEVPVG